MRHLCIELSSSTRKEEKGHDDRNEITKGNLSLVPDSLTPSIQEYF